MWIVGRGGAGSVSWHVGVCVCVPVSQREVARFGEKEQLPYHLVSTIVHLVRPKETGSSGHELEQCRRSCASDYGEPVHAIEAAGD